jgi:predicted translin family RNA/ssDNA-binding protein
VTYTDIKPTGGMDPRNEALKLADDLVKDCTVQELEINAEKAAAFLHTQASELAAARAEIEKLRSALKLISMSETSYALADFAREALKDSK